MLQKRNRPFLDVLGPLTFGLFDHPYLKVFGAIVMLHAILVVDVFKRLQWSAKNFFHNNAVLKNGAIVAPNSNVSGFLVNGPSALLLLAHARIRAFRGAIANATVRLRQKWFAAALADFFGQRSLSARLALAFVRAVNAAIRVRGLCFELPTAMGTIFRNGRIAHNAAGAAIDSGWHGELLLDKGIHYTKRNVLTQALVSA